MNCFARRFICLTFIFILLGACSRDRGSPASASNTQPAANNAAAASGAASAMSSKAAARLEFVTMMKAVFGDAYREAGGNVLAELTDQEDRNTISTYVVSLVEKKELPTGETILLMNSEMPDADGNPMSAHASSGLLSVFVLRKEGNAWKVVKRHENIAALGSFGQVGKPVWLQLAPGKPGLGMLHGGTWQGNTISLLSVFDLGAADMQDLTEDGIAIHSDNEGGCGPDVAECWDVTGKWRFMPGASEAPYEDLVVEFSGEKVRLPENIPAGKGQDVGRITVPVRETATYRFDGKKYRLMKGDNVVPRF